MNPRLNRTKEQPITHLCGVSRHGEKTPDRVVQERHIFGVDSEPGIMPPNRWNLEEFDIGYELTLINRVLRWEVQISFRRHHQDAGFYRPQCSLQIA